VTYQPKHLADPVGAAMRRNELVYKWGGFRLALADLLWHPHTDAELRAAVTALKVTANEITDLFDLWNESFTPPA
jgi:hypothetical protein